MRVGRHRGNADFVALLSRLLQQREKVGCESDMTDVVQSHMKINAVVGKLVGHNTSRSIVDQNVDAIRRVTDLLRYLGHTLPVRKVALEPFCPVRFILAQLLCYCFLRPVNDFF